MAQATRGWWYHVIAWITLLGRVDLESHEPTRSGDTEAVGKQKVKGPRTDTRGTQPVGHYVARSPSGIFWTPWAPYLELPSSWPHSKKMLSLLFPVNPDFALFPSQLLLQTVSVTCLLVASLADSVFSVCLCPVARPNDCLPESSECLRNPCMVSKVGQRTVQGSDVCVD